MQQKVILSGMDPIGQIFNFDDKRELQGRENEHEYSSIHVKDTTKINHNHYYGVP